MSDQLVRLTASDGSEVEVDLIDDFGPINSWRSRTKGAWGVDGASFTNATGAVHAKGCGVIDCWTLDGLDIDKVKAGDSGTGRSNDPSGSFPIGDLEWTILLPSASTAEENGVC